MKKVFLVLVAGVMALVLAACNDTAEPTEGASKEKESKLTAEEVYSKALEASEDMKSAEVSMNVNQQIQASDDSVAMETKSNYDTKMTMDPIALYMKGVTKMEMDGAGDEEIPAMDMEIYMVDDGMYLYSDQIGDWVKMDNSSMDMIEQMAGQQPDPSEQLKMMQDYAEDLSFEQSDDEFILKLDADGDKFNDLMQKMMQENMPDELLEQMGKEGQEALENMDINSMSFEFSVDKETYEMKTFNMDMDMTMHADNEELNIVQQVESEYSNINKVDAIEVPDDVKENAIEQ
ncbi:DUF6612 family protein [Lentibacillus sp. N15]|uniref:DUF6612 family protein n=1 Tax=Lentibacillus songyuanensis TaxID=3136161 RepID=UPI0031BAE592